MAGWIALAYIMSFRINPPVDLGLTDLLVLVLVFYGVTGYLPYMLMKSFPWKG